MADSAWVPGMAGAEAANEGAGQATGPVRRHAGLVRWTHWLSALCFAFLLLSGVEIVISHPRFYWGEAGNVLTEPLFTLPIPASRGTVPTGYNYVLPDQNGWSRSMHFQAAWGLVLVGGLYGIWGIFSKHFQVNLFPARPERSLGAVSAVLKKHLRLEKPGPEEAWSYNVLQRLTYLLVVFVLFPLMIWTGLAMSPGFTAVFPWTVEVLGGQQSARTIHFLVTLAVVAFVAGHVAMVWFSGFAGRMRAMITGRMDEGKERG